MSKKTVEREEAQQTKHLNESRAGQGENGIKPVASALLPLEARILIPLLEGLASVY